MKATWVWLLIAAVFGWVWYDRSKRPSAAKSDALPAGTNIGQIGSRIENPEALKDFADALRESSESRVVAAFGNNDYNRLLWSDGRVTVTNGSGSVVVSDIPFIPSP